MNVAMSIPAFAPETTASRSAGTGTHATRLLGIAAIVMLGFTALFGLVFSPADRNQGDSVRIMYVHVPTVWTAYLAFSVILAAGLAGIEGDYRLEEEADANIFELSEEERRAKGIRLLPSSLNDALDRMESSELVRDALGPHIHEWFLRNKRAEWNDYKSQVTQFELDRYLRNW